jgi:hypothetical protein
MIALHNAASPVMLAGTSPRTSVAMASCIQAFPRVGRVMMLRFAELRLMTDRRAPTTSRNFNYRRLSYRRNSAGDRNQEIVVPYLMTNRVRLSVCWWKTVLHTTQTALHSRSLVRSDGMVRSDRGSVHVVNYGDQDPVMLWAVDVVENQCG